MYILLIAQTTLMVSAKLDQTQQIQPEIAEINMRVLYTCGTYSSCYSLSGESYRVCINCYQYLDYSCRSTTEYQYCGYRQMCRDGYNTPYSCQQANYYYNDTASTIAGGAVAGIAIGCSFIGVIIIGCIIYRRYRNRSRIEAIQFQIAQQNLQTQQGHMLQYNPQFQPPQGYQQNPMLYHGQQSHILIGQPIYQNPNR